MDYLERIPREILCNIMIFITDDKDIFNFNKLYNLNSAEWRLCIFLGYGNIVNILDDLSLDKYETIYYNLNKIWTIDSTGSVYLIPQRNTNVYKLDNTLHGYLCYSLLIFIDHKESPFFAHLYITNSDIYLIFLYNTYNWLYKLVKRYFGLDGVVLHTILILEHDNFIWGDIEESPKNEIFTKNVNMGKDFFTNPQTEIRKLESELDLLEYYPIIINLFALDFSGLDIDPFIITKYLIMLSLYNDSIKNDLPSGLKQRTNISNKSLTELLIGKIKLENIDLLRKIKDYIKDNMDALINHSFNFNWRDIDIDMPYLIELISMLN